MIATRGIRHLPPLDSQIEALLRSRGNLDGEDLGRNRDRMSSRLMEVYRETGDQEAYRLLFDLNQGTLTRFIAHRLRHLTLSVEASDILQETFFNIYRYPYKFRCLKDSSFRVWTGAIITNIIRRHLRRKLDEPASISLVPEYPPIDDTDPKIEPINHVIEEESRTRLKKVFLLLLLLYWDAYRRLPRRDRRILQLVEVYRKKYREVGAIIDTKPDNIKMYVFRARQKVFRRMGERLAGF